MVTAGLQSEKYPSNSSAITLKSNSEASRKRKRLWMDSLTTAYSSIKFSPRTAPGRRSPDNPHFFFSSSYTVIKSNFTSDEKREAGDLDIRQVVHQHANGLCVVTVGEQSIPPSKILKSVQFIVKEAPSCSNTEKRKRQSKMLKGQGKVNNVVTPSTVIAELILEERNSKEGRIGSKTVIPVHACVWGTILELNSTALMPDIILEDPLLNGL